MGDWLIRRSTLIDWGWKYRYQE